MPAKIGDSPTSVPHGRMMSLGSSKKPVQTSRKSIHPLGSENAHKSSTGSKSVLSKRVWQFILYGAAITGTMGLILFMYNLLHETKQQVSKAGQIISNYKPEQQLSNFQS